MPSLVECLDVGPPFYQENYSYILLRIRVSEIKRYEAKPELRNALEEVRGGIFVDDIHLCGQSIQ